MPKIVHYAPLFYPHLGGAESHIVTILRFMKDYDIAILTNKLEGTADRERVEGADIVRIGPTDHKVSGSRLPRVLRLLFEAYTDERRSRRKRAWLTGFDFELLHVHTVYDVDALLRLSSALGAERFYRRALGLNDFRPFSKKTVFTEHGLISTVGSWGPMSARLTWDLLKFHQNVICVERKSYGLLNEHFQGKEAKRAWLVPNGVDIGRFGFSAPPLGERLKIGYASRLDKEGVGLLMDIAKLLPDSVELVVAGAGQTASYPPAEFRNRNNVKLLKGVPHDKMPEFYKGIDILLETHNLDIFGLNVLEAMACGRPAIRVKGKYRYPVVDGVTGWLVDNSAPAIAAKIVELTRAPQAVKEMGQQGRSLVEREFSAEMMCRKMVEIYEEIAE